MVDIIISINTALCHCASVGMQQVVVQFKIMDETIFYYGNVYI